MDSYQESLGLYLRALSDNPEDFESAWKCARAYWKYAEAAKTKQVAEWKEICAASGKLGMHYAEKAMATAPGRPDGYYYYALNAGIYADGVSMLTALMAGLKEKVQGSLEKVYELDPLYDNAEAILGLGRFWSVVPWPFRDRQKALVYYREYQSTEYFSKKDEARLYLAELLLELSGDENIAEARALLERVVASGNKDICQRARRLLDKTKP